MSGGALAQVVQTKDRSKSVVSKMSHCFVLRDSGPSRDTKSLDNIKYHGDFADFILKIDQPFGGVANFDGGRVNIEEMSSDEFIDKVKSDKGWLDFSFDSRKVVMFGTFQHDAFLFNDNGTRSMGNSFLK